MKTTIDLPPELLKQLKLRAVRDGRKLKDLAADLLRDGLKAKPKSAAPPQPVFRKHKKTGLPVIQGSRPAPPGQELTPDRVAEILNQQEADWIRESS